VQFEFLLTKKAFDTFLIANTADLSKYSALIAVGGDGSASEVFGGMLSRKDGLTVPVGYIPNGSGGITAIEAGVFSVEMALDTIIKGMVSKMSAIECIVDDDKTEIPEGLQGFNKRRFCFLGMTNELMQVQTVEAANPLKPCCGVVSYILAFFKYISCSTKKWKQKFHVTLDGISYANEDDYLVTSGLNCSLTGFAATGQNEDSFMAHWNKKSMPDVNF
jgi:diacylglycerol kinase family enzyme